MSASPANQVGIALKEAHPRVKGSATKGMFAPEELILPLQLDLLPSIARPRDHVLKATTAQARAATQFHARWEPIRMRLDRILARAALRNIFAMN